MAEKFDDNFICDSCGKKFRCGVNDTACWCFEVDLREETLEALKGTFNGCLCENCLIKENQPDIITN